MYIPEYVALYKSFIIIITIKINNVRKGQTQQMKQNVDNLLNGTLFVHCMRQSAARARTPQRNETHGTVSQCLHPVKSGLTKLLEYSQNSPKPPAYENSGGVSRLTLSPYTAYHLACNKNLYSFRFHYMRRLAICFLKNY